MLRPGRHDGTDTAATTMTMGIGITIGIVLAFIWTGWRIVSRRSLLPCPAAIGWLVELENPLARATRSERVVTHRRLAPGWRVADIGCGPGRITIPLARAVGPPGKVLALDLQPAMLARVAVNIRRAGLTNVWCLGGDARRRALTANSVDAAVMVMALGEMPEPAQVIEIIDAILKPGGRLLVAESVFDPHFMRRQRVSDVADEAGFVGTSERGSWFAFSLLFEKPVRSQVRSQVDTAGGLW